MSQNSKHSNNKDFNKNLYDQFLNSFQCPICNSPTIKLTYTCCTNKCFKAYRGVLNIKKPVKFHIHVSDTNYVYLGHSSYGLSIGIINISNMPNLSLDSLISYISKIYVFQ